MLKETSFSCGLQRLCRGKVAHSRAGCGRPQGGLVGQLGTPGARALSSGGGPTRCLI
jgi:hypothetical protein